MKTIVGKVFYGAIFMAIIPTLLVIWAHFTQSIIDLPVPSSAILSFVLIGFGSFLVVAGMLNLWLFGKGLPMNAYPPAYFVTKGVYALFHNPIYVGTALLCFGISAVVQSASGFWLVSPLFTLMMIVYTVGFENERTKQVFGAQSHKPFFSLPEGTEASPTPKHRAAAYLLTFLPWWIVYGAFVFSGAPKDAIDTHFAFEHDLPVIEFTTLFYVSIYLFALLIPLFVKSRKVLRSFILDVCLATAICGFLYFMLPFIVLQRAFLPETFWGELLLIDRAYDGVSAAFPAFHVIWAFLTAQYFSKSFPRFYALWYTLAVIISASCITTGNHSIVDVAAGFVVYLIVLQKHQIWQYARKKCEQIANSWKTWNIGSVRVINHGFYAGAGGFVGTFIIGCFLGSQHAFAGFLTGVLGIVGAALWAQFIEGSPKLQRPFGYYGSVVGVMLGGAFIALFFKIDVLVLLAAFAMAAPWMQVLGRLRCLVQGCCHGKPTAKWLGICFTHPYSRVNKISGLSGAYLHPTQLYSIAVNVFTGLVLLRFYTLGMSVTFIVGIYLVLNGLGRFVEEYFRGESQTPYFSGMRIYQWIAILSILLGAVFTCMPIKETLRFQYHIASPYWAIGMGLFATFAYGIDFPNSNRRFARLTSG